MPTLKPRKMSDQWAATDSLSLKKIEASISHWDFESSNMYSIEFQSP